MAPADDPDLTNPRTPEVLRAPDDVHGESGRALRRGARVGRYEVAGLVGEGGMGEVYVATDLELERKVALKILRVEASAGDSRGARARLLREAQAMAKLSHANVTTVYEVGGVDGQVFIAMEFVAGRSLREWLRTPRSWRQIVDAFVHAGRGLAAAHRAGLVHRDFKPDNVLVGDDGRVRVTDFGLADFGLGLEATSATDSAEGPSLALARTVSGALSGTPAYMSPEQHLRGRVDARSDEFSFCVSLYEALVGVRPFAGNTYSQIYDNVMAQRLAEPTAKVVVPAWLRAAVLRGLAVAPEARFPSMDALLAALSYDPSVWRRRALVAAAVVVAAAASLVLTSRHAPPVIDPCLGGEARLSGVWDPSLRATMEQAFAATRLASAPDTFARVADGLDKYAAAWLAMRDDACRATAVRHEQSAALLDLRMTCLDRRLGALGKMTVLLSGPGDAQALSSAVSAVRHLEPLEPCADAAGLTAADPPPSDPVVRAQLVGLRERIDVARSLVRAGRYKPGLALAQVVAAEARAVGDLRAQVEALETLTQASADLRDPSVESVARERLAVAARAHDDVEVARSWIQLMLWVGRSPERVDEALAMRGAAETALLRAGDPPALRARFWSALGNLQRTIRHVGEAEQSWKNGIELLEQPGGDEVDLAALHNALGLLYKSELRLAEAQVELEQARALYERALGPDHPYVAGALINIGNVLLWQHRFADAVACFDRAVATFELADGPDGADVATALRGRAHANLGRDRAADSLRDFQRAIVIATRRSGPGDEQVGAGLSGEADALRALGRDDEARAALDQAAAIYAGKPGRDRELGDALLALGRLEVDQRHPDQAMALADRLLGVPALAERPASTAGALLLRGESLALLGKPAAARAAFSAALAAQERAEPVAVELAQILTQRARVARALGDVAAARVDLLRAETLCHGQLGFETAEIDVELRLAELTWPTGRVESLAHARAAADLCAPLVGRAECAQVNEWLKAHGPAK